MFLPYDVVHADYVLRYIICVVDDGSSGLNPHPITVFADESVVFTD